MIRKTACSAVTLLVLIGATPAFATNGMNLEGYGPKSMAMGGTGSAYDTGNSAVMNNPATLGYMKEGTSEISFGIRGLHPDISIENGPNADKSDATAFYMPSMSYMRRDGKVTWGVAMLAQRQHQGEAKGPVDDGWYAPQHIERESHPAAPG